MAGLDGIQNKIHPGDAADKNLYDLPPEEAKEIPQVCGSLQEALGILDDDRGFLTKGGVFSDAFIDAFIELKVAEELKVRRFVHPLEYDLYYSVQSRQHPEQRRASERVFRLPARPPTTGAAGSANGVAPSTTALATRAIGCNPWDSLQGSEWHAAFVTAPALPVPAAGRSGRRPDLFLDRCRRQSGVLRPAPPGCQHHRTQTHQCGGAHSG